MLLVCKGVAVLLPRAPAQGTRATERRAPVRTAARAQAGRDRARESRLRAARERRLGLDPGQLAREQRIDGATVDVELAWEHRADAQRAVEAAEAAAGTAVERLVAERLSMADIVKLTGLDQATVRRLRQAKARTRGDRGAPRPAED